MTRPIRVLELRSVRGTGGGPEKTILLGTARTDRTRFDITVCYIRDLRDEVFDIRRRAEQLDVSYTEIHERHSFDPRVLSAMLDVIARHRTDIVHAHDYKTNFLTWLLARRAGIIPLSTAHGWSGNSWRERLYYGADKRVLLRFPAVIAVSGAIRRTLLDCGADPRRVHRISNGIDQHYFRRQPGVREQARSALGIDPAEVVLGAVGRLESEKRFDLLLDAAARLPLRTRLLIVGEGSQREALLRQADEAGLADRLLLPGLRSDVRELLHALDVYVQTSDTEGVPNAVLEAMATEVPIVATDVGGTSELITDAVHGFLVQKGDVQGLADAIAQSVAAPAAAAARVRAARDRIERELSFAARMARVEDVYRQLFDERIRPARNCA